MITPPTGFRLKGNCGKITFFLVFIALAVVIHVPVQLTPAHVLPVVLQTKIKQEETHQNRGLTPTLTLNQRTRQNSSCYHTVNSCRYDKTAAAKANNSRRYGRSEEAQL